MLLEKISSPEDLKALPDTDMQALAREIRGFLIEKVVARGGHLASNLGVVELTLALHRVFSSPHDKLIFDVGHQAYVHKLLTGRREGFDKLRGEGGVSGFTKRGESVHDPFGAGHSSTSISAALGFAKAARLRGDDAWTVAVVGDGAFTGGMIYEALNNCEKGLRLMIVLNDNEMSISRNVGRMSKYIAEIRSSKKYLALKRDVSDLLNAIPVVGAPAADAVMRMKKRFRVAFVKDSTFFERLGLRYFGPVDGNDYGRLAYLLRSAKESGGTCIVHVTTKKGLGYTPAQKDPRRYHAVAPAGAPPKNGPTFSEAFGKSLTRIAAHDESVCAVTAAMADGTGLGGFAKAFPARFFDVGIAEEHAVTFCAGLSAAGMKPVFAVYSSFLQRAYDNLIHDVSLQKLPLVLGVDRSGLSPDDGATHHGIYDVAFLSQIAGATVLSPVCAKNVEPMLSFALRQDGITAVRYPKGCGDERLERAFYRSEEDFRKIGVKTAYLSDRCRCVFISYGRAAAEALSAAEALNAEEDGCAGVILLEIVSPSARIVEKVASLLPEGAAVVFSEEGVKHVGAGQTMQAALSERFGRRITVRAIEEVPDRADSVGRFYEMCGIDAASLVRAAKEAETK